MTEYKNYLETCLEFELVLFSILYKAVIRNTGIVDKGKTQQNGIEHEMYLTMKKNEWTQTFPNVDIVLRIYLCMMTSNCSGERSFSRLKRINNELRSTMGQDHLSILSLMSIENDILRSLDFNDFIADFAMRKVRKRVF